jgi:hypothetical protein
MMTVTQIFIISSVICGYFTTLSVYPSVHLWCDGTVRAEWHFGKDLETSDGGLTVAWTD